MREGRTDLRGGGSSSGSSRGIGRIDMAFGMSDGCTGIGGMWTSAPGMGGGPFLFFFFASSCASSSEGSSHASSTSIVLRFGGKDPRGGGRVDFFGGGFVDLRGGGALVLRRGGRCVVTIAIVARP